MSDKTKAQLAAEVSRLRQQVTELKSLNLNLQQASLEQRQRSHYLEALFEHALDTILVADDHANYVDANPAAGRMLGYSREELLTLSLKDVTPDDEYLIGLELWQEFSQAGVQQGRYALRRKNGNIVITEYRAVTNFVPGRHLSVMRDITDRVQAESSLRESLDFNQAVLNSLPAQMVVLDRSGVILSVNKGWQQFGAENNAPSSLCAGVGLNYLEVCRTAAGLDADLARQCLAGLEAVLSGAQASFDLAYPCDSPTQRRWFLLRAVPLRHPQCGLVISHTDITHQRQADERIHYQANLLENVSDAIVATDLNFVITSWNKAAERIYGWTAKAALGHRIEALIPIEYSSQQDNSTARRALLETGYWQGEVMQTRINGERVHILASVTLIKDQAGLPLGVVAVNRDITERKQTEKILREALEKYRVLFETFPLGITISDKEGRIVESNQTAERLLSLPRAEHEQRHLDDPRWQLIRPDGSAMPPAEYPAMRALQENRLVENVEMGILKGEGEITWLNVTAVPIPLEGYGVAITYADITDRKQASEIMHRSEERFRTSVENMLDGFSIFSPVRNESGQIIDFRYDYINQAGARLNFRSVEEHQGHTLLDVVPRATELGLLADFTKVIETGQPLVKDIFIYDDNEDERRTLLLAFETQAVILGEGLTVSWRDITDRKKKEAEIRQLYRTLNARNNSNQALLRATSERQYLQEVCRIVVEDCGHTMIWIGFAEEHAAKTVHPVVHAGFDEDYLDIINITWADTDRGRGPTGTAIRTGQPSLCRNILTDPNFAPWREAASHRGHISVLALPLLTNGRAFGSMTIHSREPDAFSKDEIELLARLADDMAYGIEVLRLRQAHAQAEEALRQSEVRYRSLFNGMTEGFAIHEIILDEQGLPCDYRFLDINPAFERLTGLTRAQVVGRLKSEVLPDDDPYWLEIYGEVALTGQAVHIENYASALQQFFEVFAYRPATNQFAVIFMNVTDRKQAEATLQTTLQRFYLILANMSAGILLVTDDGMIEFVNESFCAMFGLDSPGKVINRPAAEIINSVKHRFPDSEQGVARVAEIVARGEPVNGEELALTGGYTYLRDFIPICVNGEPYSRLWHQVDITVQKQTEEALRVALEKYRVLFESFPLGITISDDSGQIIETNRQAERLLGVPQTEHERRRIDSPEWQILRPDGSPMPATEYVSVRALQENRLVENIEMGIVKPGGQITWISATAAPITLRNYGLAITYGDITERKAAEAQIEATLAEREVLLKELHHRVKNNLQIISSMLNLQGSSIEDPQAQAVLQEGQNRIYAMALIHEKLYLAKDPICIGMAEYMQDLAGNLFLSYGVEPSRIQFWPAITDIWLDIEMAIPFGLLFNELISNCLKHAFPAGRPGEIKVTLDETQPGLYRLMVADNGTGLPPNINWRAPKTLGLRLINRLAQQLRGNIELVAGPGTLFEVTFSRPNN